VVLAAAAAPLPEPEAAGRVDAGVVGILQILLLHPLTKNEMVKVSTRSNFTEFLYSRAVVPPARSITNA
jgi:hypothetical protein